MEGIEFLEFVDKVGGFPGWLIVANPLDVVLEFLVATGKAGVENFLHKVFLLTFNFDRWRRWDDLAWVRVAGSGGQLGDVEERMALHGRREFEVVGVRTDDLEDGEGAKSFMVELLGRTDSSDIAGVEPDLMANLEVRRRSSVVVSILLMLVLSATDFRAEVFEDCRHGGLDVFGIQLTGARGSGDVGGRHAWVASVVGQEGGHSSCLRGGIVAGELRESKERFPIVLLVTDE